jgi:hypothetical protein
MQRALVPPAQPPLVRPRTRIATARAAATLQVRAGEIEGAARAGRARRRALLWRRVVDGGCGCGARRRGHAVRSLQGEELRLLRADHLQQTVLRRVSV